MANVRGPSKIPVEGSQTNAFSQYVLLNIMRREKDPKIVFNALLIHRYGFSRSEGGGI